MSESKFPLTFIDFRDGKEYPLLNLTIQAQLPGDAATEAELTPELLNSLRLCVDPLYLDGWVEANRLETEAGPVWEVTFQFGEQEVVND